jgi:hypothetical protein
LEWYESPVRTALAYKERAAFKTDADLKAAAVSTEK